MKTTEKYQLKTRNVCLIDIETDLSHRRIWVCVTKELESGDVKTWTSKDGLAQYLAQFDLLVAHNGIGFDFPVLNRVWGLAITPSKIADTLVMSRLFDPSKENGHSLANWGVSLGLDKIDFQGDFDAGLTEEMLTYCVRDVDVLEKLFLHLTRCLTNAGFSQYSVELEHKVAVILSRQERYGFLFDTRAAMSLNAELQDRLSNILSMFSEKYPPKIIKRVSEKTGKPLKDQVIEFNPASRQMIAQVLLDAGVVLTKKTEKGSWIIDEDTLKDIDHPDAKLFCEYMMVQKRKSQIDSWFKALQDDGRVHGRVITNGAVTGRMTHHSPNMAQVPSCGSPYGKECRSLWTVPKGYKLVGADASGLELRMLAHYMKDPDYTNEVVNGDIHTKNQNAAGLETRNSAKTFIYAFLYGAGDAKIGSIVGGSSEQGRQLKERFLRGTPALKKLIDNVKRIAKSGTLPSLDGRRVWVRSEHSALNSLLQSAGAVVMKEALVILDAKIRKAGIKAHFVANVHDEWQIEVPEQDADTVGQMAVDAITEAGVEFQMRCPLSGEFKVGNNWAETH